MKSLLVLLVAVSAVVVQAKPSHTHTAGKPPRPQAAATTTTRTVASDECGNLDNGIDSVRELTRWTPADVSGGDLSNWYANMTRRAQAALLQAKLNSDQRMAPATRAEIQREIEGLCQSLD